MPLDEFLDVLDEKYDESVDWIFRTTNFQAFEMGLDPLNKSVNYLKTETKRLEETFDLVLISGQGVRCFYEKLKIVTLNKDHMD